MAETERQNDEERRVLAAMDAMTDPVAWSALVRYFAPALCRDNPKLLFEIVARRALVRWDDHRAKWGESAGTDCAEMIAQEFGMVGLRLTVV